MLTGEWAESETEFYRLIGVTTGAREGPPAARTALFIDPDTGVHKSHSQKHVSFERLVLEASNHDLVFSFDQSFSRQARVETVMREKVTVLQNLGCYAMYYNSHARFLFAALKWEPLSELRGHLISLGLPASRLLTAST